ncbi:MAG: ABC transporter ATP-binding protein [Planctomycetes bacterium]|nr:ABC transporter ATP-binding protein [Planctomycetota bacterium]
MLELTAVTKEYPSPDGPPIRALTVDRLTVPAGGHLAVAGPSGSGKSTLLAILAGITTATGGRITWDGEEWGGEPPPGHARRHARRVGFVYQDLNLLPSLTVEENLMAAAWLLGLAPAEYDVPALLQRVGLADRRRHTPDRLSRGEQQRAAVARTMLTPHPLVLADEPTASLDSANADLVMTLLLEMAREHGSALVVASHDPAVIARLDTRFELTRAMPDLAATQGVSP